MELVVYCQTYRARTPERQQELEACLRRNLNHPRVSRMVLFAESGAPPPPEGSVPVQVIQRDERITYAEWFRWMRRQGSGIGLLLNADIYLDEGLEHLERTFDQPGVFLALTRYNPHQSGLHLNDFPHWTQDVWGVRADAELPESLLYASSFPIGFPGCDNRIAYVLWSHGFVVRNPCYSVRSVHLQASASRSYDKTDDRLYGGVSYVHPSLAPNEDAELEFTIWTRSGQQPAGVLINQQAIAQGVHRLQHVEAELARRFQEQQQFTGLCWQHQAVGSVHLLGAPHPYSSEDTVFLPMPALLDQGVELELARPVRLQGLALRLPRRAASDYRLELRASGSEQAALVLEGDGSLLLKAGGERSFHQWTDLQSRLWHRFDLRLRGPVPEPDWRSDEGVELVLFAERDVPSGVVSPTEVQVAEQDSITSPVLRCSRFAAEGVINALNLQIEPAAANAPDGQQLADAIAAESESAVLKYAYNAFSSNTPGAYTASLIIKPGTQTRIVLRLNDQGGVNDARQEFDLLLGEKVGPAVNGGSATAASSSIEALGNGWYRCSISCLFHEPLTSLQAPSLWFDNYGPSPSTGTLFVTEAEIRQGLVSRGASKPALSPQHVEVEPCSDPPNSRAQHELPQSPYRWRRRRDCQELLDRARVLHGYGSRFRVLQCGDELLFEDRFWPSIGVSLISEIPCALDDPRGLLLWGFGQPTLELWPGFIAPIKRYSEDLNFWQYPGRTEADAFAAHQRLIGPQLKDDHLQLYLGLPWATWIDREACPISVVKSISDRLRKLRHELADVGLKLKVHSVCQHIFWEQYLDLIKNSGVDCLWLSHKPSDKDHVDGLELKPWSLYAVNHREPERRNGLMIRPPDEKPYLASFMGAHMPHYMTDVRLKLQAFAHLPDWLITLNDECHFNTLVYGEQVENEYILETRDVSSHHNHESVTTYNQTLSNSVFSLCPAGAGPNSIRIWESLAIGSIPVILSDHLVMPELDREFCADHAIDGWKDIVIFHPESEVDSLDTRLRSISKSEISQRSKACILMARAFEQHLCFGRPEQLRFTPHGDDTSVRVEHPRPGEDARPHREDKQGLRILREFKPQQIKNSLADESSAKAGSHQRVSLRLNLQEDGSDGHTIVCFDQAELVAGFELISAPSVDCRLQVERAVGHHKFVHELTVDLPRNELSQQAEPTFIGFPSRGFWAESIRLELQPLSDDGGEPPSHVCLGIGVEADAFALELTTLNDCGLLYFADSLSPDIHERTFLTTNINSAVVINDVRQFADQLPSEQSGRLLFPHRSPQTHNLIAESIGDGISMYVHLMNRNDNIVKNLPNWLSLDIDELILLDWSTAGGITYLPGIWEDPRVRVVRVENQRTFIRTLAQNLASKVAKNRRIFKCDSDIELERNFFDCHELKPGEFWVGDWRQARNHNERHLHGEAYYWLDDFLRIGGYDERIKTYGHDDTNFTDRMLLSGLIKNVFNYDFMRHQEHSQASRAGSIQSLHPMVSTYAHRLMTASSPLWSANSGEATFDLIEQTQDGRFLRFKVLDQVPEQNLQSHIKQALRIVGSWYIKPGDLDFMSDDEIQSVIWEKQVE